MILRESADAILYRGSTVSLHEKEMKKTRTMFHESIRIECYIYICNADEAIFSNKTRQQSFKIFRPIIAVAQFRLFYICSLELRGRGELKRKLLAVGPAQHK